MRIKTILKQLATVLTVAASTHATLSAQPGQTPVTVPDDELILAQTMDSESPYYYPGLMMRYRSGDTTLSETDYYYLYYGYAFTEDYRPLAPIPEESFVLEAFRKTYADPSAENAAELISHALGVMEKDPFSLSNINFLIYAYGMAGDSINERINYDRLNKLTAAIWSSGTGATESSPVHILRFSHANDLLGIMELEIVNRLVVSRTTEYVSVSDRNGHRSAKGYYFDYSRIYNGKNAPEGVPGRQKWKFNDYSL